MNKSLPVFPRNISKEPGAFQSGYLAALENYSGLPHEEVADLLKTRTAECKKLRRASGRNMHARLLHEGERSALHDLYYSVQFLTMSRRDLQVVIGRLRRKRFRGTRLLIAKWALSVPREIIINDQFGAAPIPSDQLYPLQESGELWFPSFGDQIGVEFQSD